MPLFTSKRMLYRDPRTYMAKHGNSWPEGVISDLTYFALLWGWTPMQYLEGHRAVIANIASLFLFLGCPL